MAVTFNNTVYQAGFAGTDDGAPSATFQIDDASRNPLTVNGTVSQPDDPITVTGILPGDTTSSTTTFYATQFDNSSMIQFSDAPGAAGSTRLILSNSQVFGTGSPNRTRFTSDGDTSLNSYAAPVCFTTGTLIRTSHGDVAIEHLKVGDLVETAAGEHRPIRWIGSRLTDTRRHPDPAAVMPVRIRAGALGNNRPARDLVVSTGHSICFDVLGEVLIPASALINGSTIVQEDVDSVTYWHVELDSHDILIAEGQPTESYLNMANRNFFANGSVIDIKALPDADVAARTHADFCRPFHAEGPVVAFVRERIQARAAAQGWHLCGSKPWAGVHLIADGMRVEPEICGLAARFQPPAGARDLWLVSPVDSPRGIGMNTDARQLGLHLVEIRVSDRWDVPLVALNDPLLCVGFHAVEGEADTLLRWTTARAKLPAALWSGDERTLMLRLDQGMPTLPHWVGPEQAEAVASLSDQGRYAA